MLGLWPKRVLGGYSSDDQWTNNRRRFSWENSRTTGYPAEIQPWLAGTLIIVADNTLHLLTNWAALEWL